MRYFEIITLLQICSFDFDSSSIFCYIDENSVNHTEKIMKNVLVSIALSMICIGAFAAGNCEELAKKSALSIGSLNASALSVKLNVIVSSNLLSQSGNYPNNRHEKFAVVIGSSKDSTIKNSVIVKTNEDTENNVCSVELIQAEPVFY
jgi:amino acid permease